MYKKALLTLTVLAVAFGIGAPQSSGQSILNQNSDDLLKEFDVDQATLSKYKSKPPTIGKAEMLLKLIGAAMPSVNVDTTSGERAIKVKAPFVNVCVNGSQRNIKVKAPFINVDTESGLSVSAPFVKVNTAHSPTPPSSTNAVPLITPTTSPPHENQIPPTTNDPPTHR